MSDRWVIALATCAAAGALRPSSLPLLLVGALASAAYLLRQPGLLCIGVALLVSALASRALEGLEGVVAEPVAAEVTLLTDPTPTFGGVRADVRLGRKRLELRADGASATMLHDRLAGERVTVRGEVQPITADAPWLTARHVAGRLRVYAVESWRPGGVLTQAVNALRRTLEAGAGSLDPVQRSLYTGLVIGDDRAQSVEMADDFRGAGLTHLLAVSGQNVAFVLVLAGPLLRRLRLWPRLGLTLAVIATFGLMTRFEPSVLRAAAMAGLAAILLTVAAPVSRLRVLALAVTALLVIDPLLVRSVGFQLSTGATMAILALSPRLAQALPGPAPLRDALSVTIAAQLGVAPVLLATFGPLPVASLPANLLAVPAAGPIMVWGLTGGLVAGLVGGSVAAVLQVPARLLLTWVAAVARETSTLPLGDLRMPHLVALAGGLSVAMWAGPGSASSRKPRTARVGLGLGVAAILAAVMSAQAPAPLRSPLLPGVVRWHAGSTDVVVLGGVGGRTRLGAPSALAALRESGVRSVALLVIADGSVSPGVIEVVESRHKVGTILLAPGVDSGTDAAIDPLRLRAPVVSAPRQSVVLDVGDLEVRLTPTADRLVVEARPRGSPEGSVTLPR